MSAPIECPRCGGDARHDGSGLATCDDCGWVEQEGDNVSCTRFEGCQATGEPHSPLCPERSEG